MTTGRPSVTRPEPSWPWSTEKSALVYGGAALALLALLGGATVLLLARRRR